MRIVYSIVLCLFTSLSLIAQSNVNLVSNLPYNQFVNDIWGYAAEDGTEYALVGTQTGLSIVSLADKANPTEVAFVAGSSSTWRDIKTFGNRAYVSTEASDGLLVIDLSDLPNSTNHYFWSTTLEGGTDSLRSCHNIYIDENGYGYLSGTNLNAGGLLILDLFSDPNQPKLVGKGQAVYSHDVYVRDNIAYSSDIDLGNISIHDVSDKSNVQLLASQQTPFAFTHNAWLSDDGKTVFTTEERGNAPTTSYDISDLNDIKELDQFVPQATKGQGVIPHNVHVLNDFLILSHYGDGCVIVDANRPENLVEVGNFDTAPNGVNGFVGSWGAYPFLPSGLILMSDSGNGLFVLEPTYTRACYLEGIITNATNGEVIPNATIAINNTAIDITTDLQGGFKTGLVESGTYEVTISKRGFMTQKATVELINGELTLLMISLEESPSFNLAGMVTVDEQGTPVGGVTVQLMDNEVMVETVSDDDGQFVFEGVLENVYSVLVGKWGYKTQLLTDLNVSESNNALIIQLEQGIEDPFALDLGWTVEDENIANVNGFELGIPAIIGDFPLLTSDVDGDIGEKCYITANEPSFEEGLLFTGKTTLTSPVFDISAMVNPQVGYATNFANVIFGNALENGVDTVYVYLENGIDKMIIDKITTDFDITTFTFSQWRNTTIKITDFLPPSETMTISFEISSTDENSAIKLGIDNFIVWDATTVSINDYIQEGLNVSVYPNPIQNYVYVQYNPQQWSTTPNVLVYDVLGKAIHQQQLATSQIVNLPTNLPAGIYFIQLVEENQGSQIIKLVKNE